MQSSVNTSPSGNMALQSSSSSSRSFRARKWFVDFSKRSDKYVALQDNVQPVAYTEKSLPDQVQSEEGTRLIGMRSWDIALGPLKQAPMNVMISWMAGNSIALFPIMFVGMLLFRPVQSIMSMSKAFEAIESGQYSFIQKVIYFFGNLVNLGIALFKLHSMGLLPTYASDWLAFANPQERMEYSFGGFSLN